MLAVEVYGSLCYLPDGPLETLVDGWGLPASEQVWRRRDLPSFFDHIDYGLDGNALLTLEQRAYAVQEIERCQHGYFFFNNGQLTYITGKHYFYQQWWLLEDSIYPEYRDTDRRYFLFLDHWEHIEWCLGILRGKKRREGASSQACSNLVYECIFYSNSHCGLVSKDEDASKDTFTEMVRHGFNNLPVFLKPRQWNRADSVTELIFAAKTKRGQLIDEGQKSKLNYRAPTLNAYDRGRMNRLLLDEGGKWPLEVDFSKFVGIVSKTLIKGVKRVGFAECPTTVNELTKGGGMAYKKAWMGSNQFKYPGRPTPKRFVTYFSAAFDGYPGFIDQNGMSVIEEPTEDQYAYLVAKWVKRDSYSGEVTSELSEDDIRKGAKHYVTFTRRKDLEGEDLEEEIRMNPCTIEEMFASAMSDCAFNRMNIDIRLAELELNPIYKRKILFERNPEDQSVHSRDIRPGEEGFHWKITWYPPDAEKNKFHYEGRFKAPGRTLDGAITVDSYSNSQGGRKYGSKASAWIGRRPDIMDPNNTGKPIGHLYGRPSVKEKLHEQVLLAAEYFGYKVWYEHHADDYLSYFRDRGKVNYLGSYPLSTIDPTKRDEADRFKGFPITPFSLTKQMDAGIDFFNYHCGQIDFEDLLENAKLFDPYDRTSYDCVVSFLMLLVVLAEPIRKPPPRKEPLVTLYPVGKPETIVVDGRDPAILNPTNLFQHEQLSDWHVAVYGHGPGRTHESLDDAVRHRPEITSDVWQAMGRICREDDHGANELLLAA